MHTYHLAVCEDNVIIREEICQLCDEILTEDKIAHKISEFSSAAELQKILDEEEECFDLLLLDIQMEGMTGMELACKLRKRGNRVSIIFITGYEDYLKDGYQVQPIDYLMKPIDRKRLTRAIHTDWKWNHSPKTIVLQKRGRAVPISLTSILYVEGANHSVVFHRTDGEETFSFSMMEIENMLPMEQFVRSHNSFLVNLDHVKEIRRSYVYLDEGKEIPIGRKYYRKFQEAFIRYMNR